jgi:hypothetical protein
MALGVALWVVFGGSNLTVTSAGMNFYNVRSTGNTVTLGNNLTVKNDLTITGGSDYHYGQKRSALDDNLRQWISRWQL